MMKKVFLVDDEIVIREGIRDTINWANEGFIYCGDAPDGEMALPLIEACDPDILITDIKMPFMDGLELSKIIRNNDPTCKIIILSGHDEFKYAREALRIGVTEYCIKPVSGSDLIQLLHQVSDQIDVENKEREEMEALKRKVNESSTLSREKLLSDLCYGALSTPDAIRISNVLKVDLLAKYYRVIFTEFECLLPSQPLTPLLCMEIDSCIFKHINRSQDELHFKRSKKENIWILKGDSSEDLFEVVLQSEVNVKALAEAAFPISLTIGIGSIQDRIQGISQSYGEAEEDKNFQIISRKYHMSHIKDPTDTLEQFVYLDRNKLIQFLKLGHVRNTAVFTADFAARIREMDWSLPVYGHYLLMDITVTLIQFINETYKEQEWISSEIERMQKKIAQVKTSENAFLFIQKVLEVFLLFRESLTDKHNAMIHKAKDFILKYYHVVDLSLQMVADEVKVSPGHLSTVFSNETGQTFIEFLTATRIRKAMELLKSTHAKSYEIAYQVGYNDSHYFSNLFKKVTGVTTKDYRKEGLSLSLELSSLEDTT